MVYLDCKKAKCILKQDNEHLNFKEFYSSPALSLEILYKIQQQSRWIWFVSVYMRVSLYKIQHIISADIAGFWIITIEYFKYI